MHLELIHNSPIISISIKINKIKKVLKGKRPSKYLI